MLSPMGGWADYALNSVKLCPNRYCDNVRWPRPFTPLRGWSRLGGAGLGAATPLLHQPSFNPLDSPNPTPNEPPSFQPPVPAPREARTASSISHPTIALPSLRP